MAYNDDRKAFFETALGHGGVLGDLEREWLLVQVPTATGNLNDLWWAYATSLGLQGTLDEKFKQMAYPLNYGKPVL